MLDASSVRCTIAPVSNLVRVSFRFEGKLVKKIKAEAKARRQTQKVVVCQALEAWFSTQQKVDAAAPPV